MTDREGRTNDHPLDLESIGMHTWSWDVASGHVTWSPGVEQLLGLPPGSFEGSFEGYQRALHPDDRDGIMRAIDEALANPNINYDIEHRVLLPDGGLRWLAARGHIIRDANGAPLRMNGVVFEVTARKAAEERMARLLRYSRVVTAVNEEIVRVHGESELFERACRIAIERGGLRFAWIGLIDESGKKVVPVAKWGHEEGYLAEVDIQLDDPVLGRGPTGTAISAGKHQTCGDLEAGIADFPWRAGAVKRGYRSSAAFPLVCDGRVRGSMNLYSESKHAFDAEELALFDGLALDIGVALERLARDEARRAAEDALRRSEDRFRMLIEHAPDAVFLVDSTLRYIDANEAACKMLGYTREELLALYMKDLLPPRELEVRPLLLDPKKTGQTRTNERTLVRKDGSHVSVEIAGAVLPGGLLQSFVRDIGARKALEAQLVRTERLASLGRLAGGVAHEINNPLAYVLLNLGLLKKEVSSLAASLESTAKIEHAVTESLDGAERVRRIVRGLAEFSRGEEEQLTAVDVNAALDSAIHIVENKIRHRARLVRRFEASRPARANEFRLGQVFVNLLVNAADAIPEGHVDENEIGISTRVDADGVVIEVSDTGPGIAADVRDHLFDPFFTTKPIGMGTGLGLSICHSIVTSFGGTIAANGELGRGATFKVVLPIATGEAVAPSSRTADGPAANKQARARILVIDDEPQITRVMATMLSEHDLTVTTNGREARALCAKESFDCILCDVMMPDMSGPEIHAALRDDGRGLERRMVFMTGGAFTARAREFLASVKNPCIDKPFSQDELENAVAAVTRERTA
jgi:PAS domain S-box-containing protein